MEKVSCKNSIRILRLIIYWYILVYTNHFERNITSTLRGTLTSMIQHQQRCSYESSMLLPGGWPAERVINPSRIAERVLSLSVLLPCHGFSAKIEVENSRDSLEKLTVLVIDNDRYVASPRIRKERFRSVNKGQQLAVTAYTF